MANFEDLDVWKRSSRLCSDIYKYLDNLKDFGFRQQITKAGLSIPSNIAEGYERDSSKEKAVFLKYAKGSSGEIRTQVFIGMDIGYIDKETGRKWINETKELSKMLHSLIRNFKNQS